MRCDEVSKANQVGDTFENAIVTMQLKVSGPYQNPSIVKHDQLFSELENHHQEDPTQNDATVLNHQ